MSSIKGWRRPSPPKGYPRGYLPDPERQDVFDPALKHHPNAFVKAEPEFSNVAERLAFQKARARVLEIAVAALADSKVRDHLVVRGSITLQHWFGSLARPAKDIDLVVVPAAWKPTSAEATKLLTAIQDCVCRALVEAHVGPIADGVRIDSIWTYERAEGRRLSFLWIWNDMQPEQLQIDVVFCEPLQTAPILESLTYGSLWFASQSESLAWKLLWLESDFHPQAKDLYDAILLAEATSLPLSLLRKVFQGKDRDWDARYEDPAFVIDWDVPSEDIVVSCPELAPPTGPEGLVRLRDALRFV
ncbi:MAG: nucleotidyl transferase AbiEii/AbiGii toxin family protein [Myxococcales bacterium]